MEVIIYIILAIVAVVAAFFLSVFFVMGIAYGYWALSKVMAPILWVILIIGLVMGLIHSTKNAIKAFRDVHGKKEENE